MRYRVVSQFGFIKYIEADSKRSAFDIAYRGEFRDFPILKIEEAPRYSEYPLVCEDDTTSFSVGDIVSVSTQFGVFEGVVAIIGRGTMEVAIRMDNKSYCMGALPHETVHLPHALRR